MKTARLVFLFCSLTLVSHCVARGQEWRKIMPLSSTRTDVERILGHVERSYGVSYELEDGNLFIEYSSGPCRPDRRGGWNVGEDVVISVHFSSKVKQRVSELKIDRKKFKEVADRHS